MVATQTILRLSQGSLLAALRELNGVTKDNPIFAAYASVLIDAYSSGEVILTAGYDMQRLAITLTGCELDGADKVSFCPELKPLLDQLSATPDGMVWLEKGEGDQIRLGSDVSNVSMPGIPPHDYPKLGLDDAPPSEIVLYSDQATLLSQAIDRCGDFMSDDVERHENFAGVWLARQQSKQTLVLQGGNPPFLATIMPLAIEWDAPPMLIPHYSVSAFAKALAAGGDGTTIKIGERWIGVDTGPTVFWCRRSEATYTDMENHLPSASNMDVQWEDDRSVLLGLMKRITAMPGLKVKGGTLSTHIASLTATSVDYESDGGDYSISQEIKNWDGPELDWSCGFDAKKLATLIRSVSGTTTCLRLDSTGKYKVLLIETPESRTMLTANQFRS